MNESPIAKAKSSFDPKRIVFALLRNVYFIIAMPILFFIPAYLYIRYTIPVYESATTLRIEVSVNSQVFSDFREANNDNEILYQYELLRSNEILGGVIQQLNMHIKYFQRGNIIVQPLYNTNPFIVEYDSSLFKAYNRRFTISFSSSSTFKIWEAENEDRVLNGTVGRPVSLFDSLGVIKITAKPNFNDDHANSVYEFEIQSFNRCFTDVHSRLSIAPFRGNSVIQLKFKDQNPGLATDFLNALTSMYLERELSNKQRSYEQTITFIDTLLLQVEQQLNASQDTLRRFENRYEIPQFTIYRGLNSSMITALNTELEAIERGKTFALSISNFVNSEINTANPDAIAFAPALEDGVSDVLQAHIQKFNDLLLELKAKLRTMTVESPPIISLLERISRQKSLINETLFEVLQSQNRRIAYIRNEIRSLEGQIQHYPQIERNLQSVTGSFDINRKIYEQLKQRRTEVAITRAAVVSNSKVLNPAKVQGAPISPPRTMILYGSFMLGLVLAVAFVVLREVLKTTVRFKAEVESLVDIPIIGQVVRFGNLKRYEHARIQVLLNPKSLLSESFRTLRANIQFVLTKKNSNVISVTSTVSTEGKSFVSINLAGIFSLLEKKVVLVDMDLRKPRLHYGFNLSNEYGASTYLIGKDTLDDIIQSSGYVNLDIITSGPIPPNPSELISSESYTQFIQELRERYDYVIVDTSPIGLVTDALPILFDSGINLYIFKANFSKKAFLENIRNLRDEHNVNDLYIVFNFAEAVAGYGVYGKYGYSYMYGYGYGYGATYGQGYIQEDDKPKGVIGRVLGLFSRKGKA